ncbi:MAG: transporter suffix domain-containing protein [Bacteroidales bacterium]|nr:transporter suffix domain-containing protein [Bacteroidales bacterium]
MIKTIGYTLFIICCISFLAILTIPLFGFSTKQAAGISLILIIIGEVTFYLSLLFLGRSFYEKIKSMLRFRKPKKNNNTEQSEEN